MVELEDQNQLCLKKMLCGWKRNWKVAQEDQPYFFEDGDSKKAETMKTANYIDMLKKKFVPALKRKKAFKNCWFMQDGAPPHCSKESMEWLSTRFQDRIISRNAEFLWPPYSPDLNPCDFYFWGYLKSKVYTNPTPKTTEELKKTSEGKRERSNLIQSSRL